MSNVQYQISNKKYDIHDRIFEFIIKVIELTKVLPKNAQNLIIISQILRSVTSMGANDQEADGASSRKDFLHCYTIVRKEGKETVFWLRLIQKTNPMVSIVESLILEGNEIVAIISTIIKNTNRLNI